MIDIIIIGDNNKITQNCIESIKATAPEANVILKPFNGNYNASLNEGLRESTSDYILLANNDITFLNGWLESALKWLKVFDTVCPIEPNIHDNVIEPIEGFKKIDVFTGWCIITKRDTIEKIGGKLDTSALFYRSDAMLAKQLIKAKCKNALIPNCFVLHKGSATLNTIKDKTKYNKLTIDQYRRVGKVKGFD